MVRRPVQTLESIRADFDRIALLPSDTWDHNSHYYMYLLSHIPDGCERILEIGCGTGEFSNLLARRGKNVMAIDLSPQMIHRAREHTQLHSNIDFVAADVMTYEFPKNHFDCIATLTTIHHLPLEKILKKIKEALKHGGVFLCLDLYQQSRLSDLFIDAAAYPMSRAFRFIKTGKLKPSKAWRDAYGDHGRSDTYLTVPEIKRMCADILPGALVKRHLFWRYSIVWKK